MYMQHLFMFDAEHKQETYAIKIIWIIGNFDLCWRTVATWEPMTAPFNEIITNINVASVT